MNASGFHDQIVGARRQVVDGKGARRSRVRGAWGERYRLKTVSHTRTVCPYDCGGNGE